MKSEFSSANQYLDIQGLSGLKQAAKEKSPEAIKQVAKQFEGVMVQMMLKSMRQANDSIGEGGVLDNEQSKMYRDMYDKQLAISLTQGRGLGLSEVIARQIGGEQPKLVGVEDQSLEKYTRAVTSSNSSLNSSSEKTVPNQVAEKVIKAESNLHVGFNDNLSTTLGKAEGNTPTKDNQTFENPEMFVSKLWPFAASAAEKIGVKPEVLLAQSALETGWGKHVPGLKDNNNSHNLFGIKANSQWNGEKIQITTSEFSHGRMIKKQDDFRSYESYQSSFNNYADFIKNNPRYQDAVKQAGDSTKYTESLQKAGYATDPNYAQKIQRILQSPSFNQTVSKLNNNNGTDSA